MKYVEKKLVEKKGVQHSFVLGHAEAVILLSLVDRAIQFMPKTIRTESTMARLRNMAKTIKEALPEMKRKNRNIDDYELPLS